MISKELINSRLQLILSRLGKTVTNSALFREELGADCPTDEEILAEDQKYLTEQNEKKSKLDIYNTALSNGFDTGKGYSLSVASKSFHTMNAYIDWIKDMVVARQFTDDTVLYLQDNKGVKHPEKVSFIIGIKLAYGAKCLEVESLAP